MKTQIIQVVVLHDSLAGPVTCAYSRHSGKKRTGHPQKMPRQHGIPPKWEAAS